MCRLCQVSNLMMTRTSQHISQLRVVAKDIHQVESKCKTAPAANAIALKLHMLLLLLSTTCLQMHLPATQATLHSSRQQHPMTAVRMLMPHTKHIKTLLLLCMQQHWRRMFQLQMQRQIYLQLGCGLAGCSMLRVSPHNACLCIASDAVDAFLQLYCHFKQGSRVQCNLAAFQI